MDIRLHRRYCASALIGLLTCTAPAAIDASTLAAFDFEDSSGHFDLTPSSLAAGVSDASWRDDLGRITDLVGNPGRALALSGFSSGNTLHLTLTPAAGLAFTLDHLSFDARASASGPTAWIVTIGDSELARGATATSFRKVELALAALRAPLIELDFRGVGATAASGTLRLDNLSVGGTLRPVPLPGPLFLLLTPVLGGLLRGMRVRYWSSPAAAASGHSCQASSRGKYSPSIIGRASMAAMMRP